MKLSLKTAFATALITLSCACNAFAAPTIESLMKYVVHPQCIYLFYVGMMESNLYRQIDRFSDWKHEKAPIPFRPRYWSHEFTRTFEINGQTLKETFSVVIDTQDTIDDKDNTVYGLSWMLSSKEDGVLQDIYEQMYDRFVIIYPGFEKSIPRTPIEIWKKKPWYVMRSSLSPRGTMGFYKSMEVVKEVEYPYFIRLGY